jgi:hypothetical protein
MPSCWRQRWRHQSAQIPIPITLAYVSVSFSLTVESLPVPIRERWPLVWSPRRGRWRWRSTLVIVARWEPIPPPLFIRIAFSISGIPSLPIGIIHTFTAERRRRRTGRVVGSSPFPLTVAIEHGWGWRIPAWWRTDATERITIARWRSIDVSYITVTSVAAISVSKVAVEIRSVGGCGGRWTSAAFLGKVSVGPEIGDTIVITRIVFGKRCTKVVPCDRSRACIGTRNGSRGESFFQAWGRGDVHAGRCDRRYRLAQTVLQGGRGRRLRQPLFQWYNGSRAVVSRKLG